MSNGTPPWTRHRFDAVGQMGDGNFDVIVIGAGYTGLYCAYRLARQGQSVCVLERDTIVGAASSRNAGFCTVSPPVAVDQLFGEGREIAQAWVDWYASAVDNCEDVAATVASFAPDPIGFRRVGNARLAETHKQTAALARQQEAYAALGHTRHLVAAPAIDLPDDGQFKAALVDRQSARLNPGALHLALAQAAVAAGVVVCQSRPARDVAVLDGRVQISLHGQEDRLTSRKVIVATNGFTNTTVAPFEQFLLSIGSFVIVSEPISDDKTLGWLATGQCHATSYRFPHYFRLLDDRRLLFGGRAGLSTQTDLAACKAWLLGRAQRLFPAVNFDGAQTCWGGRLGFAVDKRPLLGRLDDKIYYAMGCAGHGVPTTLAMARDLTDHMLGNRRQLAPFWREPDRPPTVIPKLVRRSLPIAQSGLRMLDLIDRLRDRVPVTRPAVPSQWRDA